MAYVDMKTYLPMRMEYFKSSDKPYRTMEVLKVEEIASDKSGQTYPTVTVSKVKNLETGSETVMTFPVWIMIFRLKNPSLVKGICVVRRGI